MSVFEDLTEDFDGDGSILGKSLIYTLFIVAGLPILLFVLTILFLIWPLVLAFAVLWLLVALVLLKRDGRI